MSLGDGAGFLCPPCGATGVVHRDVNPVRGQDQRWHPGLKAAGGRPPLDTGCYPPLWESRRLRDLERDLEDAQATCQALSSEQDCGLQELQRVRADLHRSEGDLASIQCDHATVSGELVRQRARTRSLEEAGSSIRRQLVDAQQAARDVAGAVDERLPGTSPPSSRLCSMFVMSTSHSPRWRERSGAGCPRDTGRPIRRTRIFREICASLLCAAVLNVDPPMSPEQLSGRLWVPIQPVLHFPTEAVGQGPQPGLPTNGRPAGRAQTPHGGLGASPAVRMAGQPDAAATPGNRSGGDTTPSATDAAGVATSTLGRDELRALLVYLNEVPPDSQTGEAQKLHLHLATRLDLPQEFPQSNLRSQYTALRRLLPTRPELGQLVREFVWDRRAAPPGSQTPALDSQGAAKVAAASQANQAGGRGKCLGKGKSGQDYDTYSVAVMVRWPVNPPDSPEAIYPLFPGRLGMVLKKAFRDFRVSYIKDEGQLCRTGDGGWALVGVRPKAASSPVMGGGNANKQFTYECAKANKQPNSSGMLRADHMEKSNAVLQRIRSVDLMARPNGVSRARDPDGAREEVQKQRRSPFWSPRRASHRSEGDYTPR